MLAVAEKNRFPVGDAQFVAGHMGRERRAGFRVVRAGAASPQPHHASLECDRPDARRKPPAFEPIFYEREGEGERSALPTIGVRASVRVAPRGEDVMAKVGEKAGPVMTLGQVGELLSFEHLD
jgi:hypothetical protein